MLFRSEQIGKTITDCLVRTLGRLAVQHITQSTVNWINSGFEGKPAFVQDFNQFFTDVADEAAGEFIQGSGLSFLCSPFQLKVRIAIAQSYARRNYSPASCTLSQVTDNVKGFILLIWCLGVVVTIDNVLKPIFIGSRIQMPTIFLLFGILGGLAVFGALGLILGPVLFALLTALLDLYSEEYGADAKK